MLSITTPLLFLSLLFLFLFFFLLNLQFSCFRWWDTFTNNTTGSSWCQKITPQNTKYTKYKILQLLIRLNFLNWLVRFFCPIKVVDVLLVSLFVCCWRQKLKVSHREFFFSLSIVYFDPFINIVPPRREQVTSLFPLGTFGDFIALIASH